MKAIMTDKLLGILGDKDKREQLRKGFFVARRSEKGENSIEPGPLNVIFVKRVVKASNDRP